MPRVVDSSTLYALIDGDDEHHARAREDIGRGEPLAVPSEILVETIHLVAYRTTEAVGRQALRMLLALPNLTMADQVPIEGVARTYEEGDGALSLADAVVVQTCRVLGAEPLAYDAAILAAVGHTT